MELQPLPPQRQAGIQKALASIHKSEVRIEARRSTAASSDPTLRGRKEAAARKTEAKTALDQGSGAGGRGWRRWDRPGREALWIDRGGRRWDPRVLDSRKHDLGREPGATRNWGRGFISAGNNHAGEEGCSGIGRREGSIMSSDMLTI